MHSKIIVSLFAIFLLFSAIQTAVFAESTKNNESAAVTLEASNEVSLGKGYYEDAVKPGEELNYYFKLTNKDSKESAIVTVYASDAIPIEGGGRGYRAYNEKNSLVGTWIQNGAPKEYVLKPNSVKELNFKVKVPKNVKPGQHVGLIVMEQNFEPKDQKQPNEQEAVLMAKIRNIFGIQMVLNYDLANAIHQTDLVDFKVDTGDSGVAKVSGIYKNEGTILEKPVTKLTITNVDTGEVKYEGTQEAGSIYGGTEAGVPFLTNMVFGSGKYKLHFDFTIRPGDKTESKDFYWNVSSKEATTFREEARNLGKIEADNLTLNDWINNYPWLFYGVVPATVILVFIPLILLFRQRNQNKTTNRKEEIVNV